MEGDTEEYTKNGDHGDEGVSYKRLLEEYDKELYAGCKYSNLSFTLHLYHIKCIGGISNKTFSMILELVRDAYPHLTTTTAQSSSALVASSSSGPVIITFQVTDNVASTSAAAGSYGEVYHADWNVIELDEDECLNLDEDKRLELVD
ncbi:hypothetical protein Tco_0411763 [Tanacetum coccineum]